MSRKELEVKAKSLAVEFTDTTSDETLSLMIQLAESRAEAEHLADTVAKLETAKELKSDLPVIKLGKKLYKTTAQQFLYNPYKLSPAKRGAGGLFNRSLTTEGDPRVVKMADLEKEENKEVAEWLLNSNSPLLEEVNESK
jgi:hypothetical protein